ncbi:hypothetical protein MHUMG1_07968 [Metarhizium humberi]|uniref:Uncharacterized protein n=1 Tax=Metarhizium humberi TaxID=2596975 RepID=A0A9P8M7B0_9HYPO|nr:hypothetical protein MHUMG1_07968 [Metarhizium humberi]
MTHNLGLGARTSTVADVERQLAHVVDRMKELDTQANHDLADVFGYSDQSTAQLDEYSQRAVLNKTMAGSVQQLIRACKERNQALDDGLRKDDHLDDLGALVREQEDSVGQRAFDHILRNPNISVAMLQCWGPAWSDKLEKALRELDRPDQLPIGIMKDLQGDLDQARGEIAQLLEDKAKLATELEAVRFVQAERRQSATEKLQSAERQAREAIEENKRLRDELASLDKESAASRAGFQLQAEREAIQTSLVDASINVMESITDSQGQPEEDWDVLLHYVIDSPLKLAAESAYTGWLWLDVWSGNMTDKIRPYGRHADQALIKLFFALGRDKLFDSDCEVLTLLQCVVSALAAATEVSEGLCKLAVDAISSMPACELPICLMLGQILQVVSERWPSVGADLSGFVGRQRAWLKGDDGALVEAILQGQERHVCDTVRLYARTTLDENSPGVVIVESVDMFLYIDARGMRLRWIGADCVDWEDIGFDALKLKSPTGIECIHALPHSGALALALIRMKLRVSQSGLSDEPWEGIRD